VVEEMEEEEIVTFAEVPRGSSQVAGLVRAERGVGAQVTTCC